MKTVADETHETLRQIAQCKADMEAHCLNEQKALDRAQEPFKARLKELKTHLEALVMERDGQGVFAK